MINNAYCSMLNWQPYLGCVNVTGIKLVQFRYKMNTLTNLLQLSLFVSK